MPPFGNHVRHVRKRTIALRPLKIISKAKKHALNLVNYKGNDLSMVEGPTNPVKNDVSVSNEFDTSNAHNVSSADSENKISTEASTILSDCLFCNFESATFQSSLTQMSKAHGMFIPIRECLTDAAALITYLYEAISSSHTCISCGTKKGTTEGIQQHMLSKGHCMISFDADPTLYQFYDTASTSDTDSNDALDSQSDNESKPQSGPESSETELRLPSGKTLGHRSQSRYYRQNLHNHPSPAEQATRLAIAATSMPEATEDPPPSRQLVSRANGGWGMVGVPEAQQCAMRVTEKKMLKLEMRARNEYRAAVEKGGNQQKYFKPDVPGPRNG